MISLQFRKKGFFLQQNSEKGCANKSALEPVICTKTAPFFCPPNLQVTRDIVFSRFVPLLASQDQVRVVHPWQMQTE